MGFSIGKISFAAALFGVLVTYGNFWVRSFIAWYHKKDPPKDRVRFGAIAFGIVFFILGSVVQASADQVSVCTEVGNTLGRCIFALH